MVRNPRDGLINYRVARLHQYIVNKSTMEFE